MLTPRIEEGKPRMIPLHIEMVKGDNASYWFGLKLEQG